MPSPASSQQNVLKRRSNADRDEHRLSMRVPPCILPDGWLLLDGGSESPCRRPRRGLVVHQGEGLNEKTKEGAKAVQGRIETMVRKQDAGYPSVDFVCKGPFLNVALVLTSGTKAEVHVEGPIPEGWAGIPPGGCARLGTAREPPGDGARGPAREGASSLPRRRSACGSACGTSMRGARGKPCRLAVNAEHRDLPIVVARPAARGYATS